MVEIDKEKKSLAVSVACMAIYCPTPGFKGRTFKLRVLTRWDFNFCVRSSLLRGVRLNHRRFFAPLKHRPEDEQSAKEGVYPHSLWPCYKSTTASLALRLSGRRRDRCNQTLRGVSGVASLPYVESLYWVTITTRRKRPTNAQAPSTYN